MSNYHHSTRTMAFLNFQDHFGRNPVPGCMVEAFQGLLFRLIDINENTAVLYDNLRVYVVSVLPPSKVLEMDSIWRARYGNYHFIAQYPAPPGFHRTRAVKNVFPHPVLGNEEAFQTAKAGRIIKKQLAHFRNAMAELRALPDIGSDYLAAKERFYNITTSQVNTHV